MPNPFPGMNPYLEDPALWPGVHSRLVTYVADALAPQIAPRYVARVEESVTIDDTGREFRPDVLLAARNDNGGNGHQAPVVPGGVAVAIKPLILELPEEPPHRFIEIRDPHGSEVITVIEVLSPANKTPLGYGHRKYLHKLEALLDSKVNLVEIDLLRGGLPATAVEVGPLLGVPRHDYIISVSRGHQRGRFEAYPFTVRDSLPPIGVPLRERETDVILELAPLLDRVYDFGGYDTINFREAPPLPPLDEADAAWLDALLKEKGLRPRQEKIEEKTS